MQKIESYFSNIYIDNNSFELLNKYLEEQYESFSQIFIIVDENTHEHCLPTLINNVEKLRDAEIIEIESGEDSKNIELASQIWQMFLEFKADKNALIINLGGGVISDFGGFVASQYKRGLKYINIPTSLLGMVDASIGGKVNINLNNCKNAIGSYFYPTATFVNTYFLGTLNNRHYKNGLAELIKHFLISGKESFEQLLKNKFTENTETFDAILTSSLQIKNKIICQDPYEKDIRKTLNFGHTIGHAIESYSIANTSKELYHGEAICIGMICESYIAMQLNYITSDYLEKIKKYLTKTIGKFDISDYDKNALFEIMQNDKKNSHQSINFSLIKEKEFSTIDNYIEKNIIFDALSYYISGEKNG